MRVAIMQPYFVPYAGYFRLFAAADLFVIYDCVQFPRRGWVHRNRLPGIDGAPRWLTLPLAKAARDTAIKDLTFRPEPEAEMTAALNRFPALATKAARRDPLVRTVASITGSPVDYLEATLAIACKRLGLEQRMVRSSTLDIAPDLRAQDRILAIAAAVGADVYVNAPGGLDLYDPHAFAERGIDLRFLPPYRGDTASILHRLAVEDDGAVAQEVARQSALLTAHDLRQTVESPSA